jgi:hypothetical protein
MCTKSGAGLALEAMRLVPQPVGLARLAPVRALKLVKKVDFTSSARPPEKIKKNKAPSYPNGPEFDGGAA